MGAGLIVAGGAAWTIWKVPAKEEQDVPVPVAFDEESIRQKFNKPEEITKLYSSAQYEALTDEQRRQVDRNKARAYSQMVQDRVDEYFEAGDADREAILDRHLDEFTGQMDRHKKTGEAEEQPWPQTRKLPKNTLSRQERKAKSELANPDRMARLMAYKMAIIKRAQARGIDLPGLSSK